jgi:hypothetical protein
MLKAISDDEGIEILSFEVTGLVSEKLDQQRAGLDRVDPKQSGKQRYEEARARGCFASVAKGAKDRELKPGRIFIPGTETSIRNRTLRISALKLTIPEIPQRVTRVKGVDFVTEGGVWKGQIEVFSEFAAMEAAA